MKRFTSSSDEQRLRWWVFKKIPWFYHVIFLIMGAVVAILFQCFYIKTWTYPYFFIFVIATLISYVVLLLLISPFIKQNWFWRRTD